MGSNIGLSTEFCGFLTEVRHKKWGKKWLRFHMKLCKKPVCVNEVKMNCIVKITNFYLTGCEDSCGRRIQDVPFDIVKFPDGVFYYVSSGDKKSCDFPLTNEGALIIDISVELYSPKRNTDVTVQLGKFTAEKFMKKLLSDMTGMVAGNGSWSGAYSPTKMICSDGVEIQVNRGMISARSPIFLRMFQLNTEATKTGVVQEKDISSPAMNVILHFLYCGMLSEGWQNAGIVEDLVLAASKFELKDLMEFLDQILGFICTEENAGTLLMLAKELNMKKAKEDLFRFFKDHCTCIEDVEKFVKCIKSPSVVEEKVEFQEEDEIEVIEDADEDEEYWNEKYQKYQRLYDFRLPK